MITFKHFLEQYDDDHHDAYHRTGFWGRRGAGCLFLARSTGKFLFAHRSNEVLEPNTWGTWGGAIDGSETPEEAVRREVLEEAGHVGDVAIKPLWIFKHKSGFEYHNFLAIVDDEFIPQLNWETSGYKWVGFGNWPKPLHPGVAALLEHAGPKLKHFSEAEKRES